MLSSDPAFSSTDRSSPVSRGFFLSRPCSLCVCVGQVPFTLFFSRKRHTPLFSADPLRQVWRFSVANLDTPYGFRGQALFLRGFFFVKTIPPRIFRVFSGVRLWCIVRVWRFLFVELSVVACVGFVWLLDWSVRSVGVFL